MKLTCLLLLSLPSITFGILKEIVITGNLDHGDNVEFFRETLPVPFEYRLQFDTEGLDEEPATNHGKFEFEGLPVSLRFGDYVFETVNTEVQVWSGDRGFWGFTFGNEDAFEWAGDGQTLTVGAYELYGSYISPFTQSQQEAPTDELRWLRDGFHSGLSSYVNVVGMDQNGAYTRLQETGTAGFTVVDVVPEPTAFGLLMIYSAFYCWRRRTKS